MPTTQQLRFGAYWDAIPPFYSTQGLPPVQESNREKFTDTSNLMPVEMPKDLVLKFLWQVKSVTIKLEYEFDPKNQGGWISSIRGLTTDQISVIETKGPFILENAAIEAITSRELRIPQGYVGHYFEPYPTDRDEARDLARQGFGAINPLVSSDYADFTVEKTLLISAIDTEAETIKEKLAEIKAFATASSYNVLKNEIERQEESFDLAVIGIKEKYQGKIDLLTTQYEEGSSTEYRKTVYGKQVQVEINNAIYEVKQEAQLQWFDWEGGFDQQVSFLNVGKYRIQAPQTLHFPPRIGGLFAGIYQTTEQLQSFSNQCMAVISPSNYFFNNLEFLFTQEFQYEQEFVFNEISGTNLIEDGILVSAKINKMLMFSTDKNKAAALKIEAIGDGAVVGGSYTTTPPNNEYFDYTPSIGYFGLFNPFTENLNDPPPPFPVVSNPYIAEVVLSGEYFGNGNYSAAIERFQPIADKLRELKEIGTAAENGTLEFRGKDNSLLFEAPLFVKTCIPIKNVRVTYKIDKLYTDPPDDDPPA